MLSKRYQRLKISIDQRGIETSIEQTDPQGNLVNRSSMYRAKYHNKFDGLRGIEIAIKRIPKIKLESPMDQSGIKEGLDRSRRYQRGIEKPKN